MGIYGSCRKGWLQGLEGGKVYKIEIWGPLLCFLSFWGLYWVAWEAR